MSQDQASQVGRLGIAGISLSPSPTQASGAPPESRKAASGCQRCSRLEAMVQPPGRESTPLEATLNSWVAWANAGASGGALFQNLQDGFAGSQGFAGLQQSLLSVRLPDSAEEAIDWEGALKRQNAANDELCSENSQLQVELKKLQEEVEALEAEAEAALPKEAEAAKTAADDTEGLLDEIMDQLRDQVLSSLARFSRASAELMKENKKIACSRRRAVALLAAALLTAAAFWASVSRIAAAMTAAAGQYRDDNLPPWREGFLDVHHLQVGASQSTFIVMPDGSTMLIDAGDLATKKPGKCAARDPIPNSTRTTAGWISEYVRTFWPHDLTVRRPTLDFVLVTLP
eukprot:s2697_g7.t2